MTDTAKSPGKLQSALEEVARHTGVQPWVVKMASAVIVPAFIGAYGWYKADMAALDTKIEETQKLVQQNYVEQSGFKERTTTSLEYIQRSIDRLLPPAQRVPPPDFSAIEENAEDAARIQVNAHRTKQQAAVKGGAML